MSLINDRMALRRQFRQARRALSQNQQAQAAQQICQQVQSMPELAQAKRIAAYLANDGEVSLAPTLAACWQRDIATSLPVLHPVTKTHLLMLDYHLHTSMTRNRFNIAEPQLACQAIRLLSEHTLIFMPLVGFDEQGNRLGMGGGFYDRTLANLKNYAQQPLLFGVAHDCQQAESLPIQPWDVPLDGVITPTQIIRTKRNH
ncbi:5-formyltetrahydrofolate cyclo-ligase [Alteromonas pelagimontana]|uniref:5-formyltetrahydrofolate cyclo-ligase n=1 Tax=Alteromonas pelagimontana TaxID=1858656 RepID=A0A6M4M9X9_9ALTE|nr:5-formyltetrahydrofolate cyclo-ligase [Alteromonas pelagimontana]QJR79991.1 5-formyltetrahydrofolate cyclo-ligase [Alteromonas pelagimontana]